MRELLITKLTQKFISRNTRTDRNLFHFFLIIKDSTAGFKFIQWTFAQQNVRFVVEHDCA